MRKMLSWMIVAAMVLDLLSFASAEEESSLPKIDMTKWQYEASDDVYWQVGLSYAANPAASNYETMGIFVPGAYFSATDNGDGTYTCSVNESGTAGQYTALTAPLILPVNTPGYDRDECKGNGAAGVHTDPGSLGRIQPGRFRVWEAADGVPLMVSRSVVKMNGIRRGRGLIMDRDSDSQGLTTIRNGSVSGQKCGKSDRG